MYISSRIQNIVIVDFQLIYETDSFIQLDFYAEGYKRVPFQYAYPIYMNRVSYGFLKGKFDDHIKHEKVFKQYLQDAKWVQEISKEMVFSIKKVHLLNLEIERFLRKKVIPVLLWKQYFSLIADMISFKKFSDECKPISFAKSSSQYEKEVLQLHFPSHIYLFHQKFGRLIENPTTENMRKFIDKYGFLYDFNIALNPFETIEGLHEKIESKINHFHLQKRKKEINKVFKENFAIQICKRIAWYEEWRHYYQARAIRNYRRAMEMVEMDICRTGIDEFHETIERRKNSDYIITN